MNTIRQACETLATRHREARYVLRGELRGLESKLLEELEEFAKEAEGGLLRHMRQVLEKCRGLPKHELVSAVESSLRASIAELFADWHAREEREIAEAFAGLTSRFSREAAETVGQIQQLAAREFGFSWTPPPLPEGLSSYSDFRIQVDELMTWGLGQFPFLLSRGLFLRYLGSRLAEACQVGTSPKCRTPPGRFGRPPGGKRQLLPARARPLRGRGSYDSFSAPERAAALGKESRAASQRALAELSAAQSFLREIETELAAIP